MAQTTTGAKAHAHPFKNAQRKMCLLLWIHQSQAYQCHNPKTEFEVRHEMLNDPFWQCVIVCFKNKYPVINLDASQFILPEPINALRCFYPSFFLPFLSREYF